MADFDKTTRQQEAVEVKVDEIKFDETMADENKADEVKDNETVDAAEQADETKAEKTEAAETEAAETEAAETKADETEDGKEEEGKTPDLEALQTRVVDAELRAAAALAGIPANRIPYAVRLADKAKAADTEDLPAYAAAQIKQIVQDLPELAAPVNGTGSAGEHARKTVSVEEQARQTFASYL